MGAVLRFRSKSEDHEELQEPIPIGFEWKIAAPIVRRNMRVSNRPQAI
jgi:hypothetical protein